MLKSLLPRLTVLSTLVLVTPAIANGLKPSQEFLEYLAEYGDENGEVIDPLELDEILSMKEESAIEQKNAGLDHSADNHKVRNTDMKIEQKSSVQSSAQPLSSNAKGTKQ